MPLLLAVSRANLRDGTPATPTCRHCSAFYCAPTPLSEGRSSILGQSQAPLPPAVPESAVRSLTQRLASDMRSRYDVDAALLF